MSVRPMSMDYPFIARGRAAAGRAQPENGLQLNSVYARGFRLTPVMAMTANQTACA